MALCYIAKYYLYIEPVLGEETLQNETSDQRKQ
jgi:hypothetical protein